MFYYLFFFFLFLIHKYSMLTFSHNITAHRSQFVSNKAHNNIQFLFFVCNARPWSYLVAFIVRLFFSLSLSMFMELLLFINVLLLLLLLLLLPLIYYCNSFLIVIFLFELVRYTFYLFKLRIGAQECSLLVFYFFVVVV